MTTQEKAQAYDKAYETAKRVLQTDLHESGVWAIKRIFPDLAESEDEDERIREWLIKTVHLIGVDKDICADRETMDKAIAWLEKQKELPTNEEMLRTLRLEYEKGVADTIAKYEQKEQTPVECTELTWKDIVELEGIINNVHYDFSAGIGQESFGKEVLERFRNKKDDAEVDACEQNLSDIAPNQFNGITYGMQGHSTEKPEWSEEDEAFLKVAIAICNRYSHKDIADWLKSLRPQPRWKPSEEQMDALRVTLEYMPDTFKPRCTLMTLQNDLEKLM